MRIFQVNSNNMRVLLAISLVVFCGWHAAAVLAAPQENIVDGRIVELVPSKKEIYVLANGVKNEYYFLPDTKVLQNGAERDFSALMNGARVKVIATKIGKRLDPKEVTILE